MRPDDATRVRHMRDAVAEALKFTQGRTRVGLETDRMLAMALMRELEVVGEAAAGVSAAYRALHGEIPWKEMVAMRNRLAHGYFDVDLDLLWTTIQDDLPPLVSELARLVGGLPHGPADTAAARRRATG